ncbi:MAG: ComEA family DNA-binding protein [Spirochaetota bacterium]
MNKTERYALIFLFSTLAAGVLFFSMSKYHFYQKYITVDNIYKDNIPVLKDSDTEGDEKTPPIEKETYRYNRTENKFKQVDINNADLEELIGLPGIGREIAMRIIDYRTTHGPFKELRELIEIKGIGEKKLEILKEYIMIK